jgi:RNA polymerase sigma-70 factor (ECF subfamily)
MKMIDRRPEEKISSVSPINLEVLFNMHYRAVYNVAFYVSGDRNLAEDATQETFLKAYHKLNQLRDTDKVEAWLVRISMNAARDLLRRRKRASGVALDHDLPDRDGSGDPEQRLLSGEEKHAVAKFVGELAPEYHEVVYLKYYREMTTIQISEYLEIPEGTVKTRLRKARSIIAAKLGVSETIKRAAKGGRTGVKL